MKRRLIFPLLLAIGLAATNWKSSKIYDREIGITSESIEPALLGIIFCCAAIYFLGGRSFGSIKDSLKTAIVLCKKMEAEFLFSILLLTPLLFQFYQTKYGIMDDGTSYSHTFGFGSEHGWILFFLGSLTILLFQTSVENQIKREEQIAPDNCGKRPPLSPRPLEIQPPQ